VRLRSRRRPRTALPHAIGVRPRVALPHAIALDVGGTFTDITLLDARTGRLVIAKTPTTPADPARGFLAGMTKALSLAAFAPADIAQILHGTTIATNAVLEGKGVATGLLTTAGFRYVLEIGRHDIPRHANMFAWQKPPRPVPPELIFEIPERLAVTGAELEPVDAAAVRQAARRLRESGWPRPPSASCTATPRARTNAARERSS
jgi:N-methylhydantoinase A